MKRWKDSLKHTKHTFTLDEERWSVFVISKHVVAIWENIKEEAPLFLLLNNFEKSFFSSFFFQRREELKESNEQESIVERDYLIIKWRKRKRKRNLIEMTGYKLLLVLLLDAHCLGCREVRDLAWLCLRRVASWWGFCCSKLWVVRGLPQRPTTTDGQLLCSRVECIEWRRRVPITIWSNNKKAADRYREKTSKIKRNRASATTTTTTINTTSLRLDAATLHLIYHRLHLGSLTGRGHCATDFLFF